jgi:hypothetical protein
VLEYYGNYEYIVNVLCENREVPELACQGKCHLKKQIEKYAQPPNSEQNRAEKVPAIDLSKYPISFISTESTALQKLTDKLQKRWFTLEGKIQRVQNRILKPPLS